ncbi:ISAs1 family transposase [Cupriavidus necator]
MPLPQRPVSQIFLDAFADLPDPRTRNCPYPLEELLFIALCGVTSGADSWGDVDLWAKAKRDWLLKYLPMANGIASHDTFSRVFSLLDAKAFEACFFRWMQHLVPALTSAQIAIDGKCLRGSHDGALRPTHLVSAWHQQCGLVLGQVRTEAKSNEITAIPELIDALDIRGALVSIDAIACQPTIAQHIVERQGDYLWAVKNNQPTLAQRIEALFDTHDAGNLGVSLQESETVGKDHGRLETRRCTVAHKLDTLGPALKHWPAIKTVARIRATREIVNGRAQGECSTEWRYDVSSRILSAEACEAAVRAHWSIENGCHWVLDVQFSEDDSRIRVGDGAENFAILRRISLNLIKQETSSKKSMNSKRLKAGWCTDYLQKVLGMPS